MSTSNLRKMLSSETERILSLSQYWQEILDSSDDIPEDVEGRIRAHIGLSKLLVNDKFQQFAGLLHTYDSGIPDVGHKMTITDLEGFWDLIYIQVDDTIKKYHILQLLKQNDWEESYPPGCLPSPQRRSPLVLYNNNNSNKNERISRATSSRKSPRVKRNYSEEARKRLAEVKQRFKRQQSAKKDVGASTSYQAARSPARAEQDNLD